MPYSIDKNRVTEAWQDSAENRVTGTHFLGNDTNRPFLVRHRFSVNFFSLGPHYNPRTDCTLFILKPPRLISHYPLGRQKGQRFRGGDRKEDPLLHTYVWFHHHISARLSFDFLLSVTQTLWMFERFPSRAARRHLCRSSPSHSFFLSFFRTIASLHFRLVLAKISESYISKWHFLIHCGLTRCSVALLVHMLVGRFKIGGNSYIVCLLKLNSRLIFQSLR